GPRLLRQVQAGQHAVGDHPAGVRALDRAAQLAGAAARGLVELGLHSPRSVEGGALLDRLDGGAGDAAEDGAERLADVLRAEMTGDVIRDRALRRGEVDV